MPCRAQRRYVPARHCVARAARLEHLDRDAVARLHAPTLGGPRSDRLDHADGLVAGNEGEPGREGAGVLLVVGAAQATRLDAQEPVVVADGRDVEVVERELSRCLEDEGAGAAHDATNSGMTSRANASTCDRPAPGQPQTR